MKEKVLEPKNIIIRMPNWIGDFVMATPILTDIRNKFPNAFITAMCRKPLGDFLAKDKDIDEVFSFQKVNFNLFKRKEERAICEKIKRGEFDLGILLTNSFSSAWWFYLGGVKQRLGYKTHYRNFLLNQGIVFPKEAYQQHQVITYKQLIEPLGIPISETNPRIYLSEHEKKEALTLLKQQGYKEGKKLFVLHPGASFGTAKCWLPERFLEVCKAILKNPEHYIVFIGNDATGEIIHEIVPHLNQNVINLAGKTTLRQLACIISLSTVLLTNDSGPMHIAAALNVPLVALFGSTSPEKTGPYPHGEVICKKAVCSPCYQRICSKDFRCMKEITSQEVLDKLRKYF
jgi:heptosyltransferase-2